MANLKDKTDTQKNIKSKLVKTQQTIKQKFAKAYKDRITKERQLKESLEPVTKKIDELIVLNNVKTKMPRKEFYEDEPMSIDYDSQDDPYDTVHSDDDPYDSVHSDDDDDDDDIDDGNQSNGDTMSYYTEQWTTDNDEDDMDDVQEFENQQDVQRGTAQKRRNLYATDQSTKKRIVSPNDNKLGIRETPKKSRKPIRRFLSPVRESRLLNVQPGTSQMTEEELAAEHINARYRAMLQEFSRSEPSKQTHGKRFTQQKSKPYSTTKPQRSKKRSQSLERELKPTIKTVADSKSSLARASTTTARKIVKKYRRLSGRTQKTALSASRKRVHFKSTPNILNRSDEMGAAGTSQIKSPPNILNRSDEMGAAGTSQNTASPKIKLSDNPQLLEQLRQTHGDVFKPGDEVVFDDVETAPSPSVKRKNRILTPGQRKRLRNKQSKRTPSAHMDLLTEEESSGPEYEYTSIERAAMPLPFRRSARVASRESRNSDEDVHDGAGIESEFIPYKNSSNVIYEYFDDPNELCDRLRLLVSSKLAGNTNHKQEINSIVQELRELGLIQ